MNTKLVALMACLWIAGRCVAQTPASIPLWPGVAPGSEGQSGPEVTVLMGTAPNTFLTVAHITAPSITPFLPPAGKASGAALIIAPGGGHRFLAIEHEGYAVARVLSAQGIACFVLKYRLAREANSPYKVEVHELMDAQRAIRLVRSRAGEWGVDPHKIGIIGFSAGGELALLAATRFDKPVAGTDDAVDKVDCRPDFQALMYPGGISEPVKLPLGKQTPPAFLCCDNDDRVSISKYLGELYVAMKDAGVPAEIHIYNSGGHGFGVRDTNHRPNATWTDRLVDWMRDRGLL